MSDTCVRFFPTRDVPDRSVRHSDLSAPSAASSYSPQRPPSGVEAALLALALDQCVVLDAAGYVILGAGLAFGDAGATMLAAREVPIWDVPIWDAQEDGRERIQRAVQRALAGQRHRLAARVQGLSGIGALEVQFAPLVAPPGLDVLGVVVDVRDITAQLEAESELRASERKFAGILAVSADAIITVDESHDIIHFNRGAEQIFGYDAQDVLGKSLSILLPERYRGRHDAHMRAFGAGPGTSRVMGERREIAGRRADGSEFPAEASISRLELPGRRLFTVQLRDITQRARRERDEVFLAEAGVALTRSLDPDDVLDAATSLPLGVLADAVWLELHLGDGMTMRSTLLPAHEAGGVPRRDAFRVRQGLDGLLADVTRRRMPLRIRVLDGGRLQSLATPDESAFVTMARAASVLAVPLLAREHVVGGMLLARGGSVPYDDVDLALADEFAVRVAMALDNAVLYRTAREATRGRDRVLGVVSHDLRQPLAAVAMCTRVLRDSPPRSEAQQRELLQTVHDATALMQRMIQDLLDISSIEAGQLALQRGWTTLGPLVARALDLAAAEARARDVVLRSEVTGGELPAWIDSDRVQQALGNLLANAIKFSPRGGDVLVSLSVQAEAFVLSVTDRGVGMAADDLPFVFDLYWHGRKGARHSGTGYGLAIVRGIVESHDGHVHVRSTLGAGSTFTIELPRRPQHTDPD